MMDTQLDRRDALDVLLGSLRTLATEVPEPVRLQPVQGQVPSDLHGVLLRNGPGRSERAGVRYGHPFDGDGFIQRLAIRGGEAHYSARFVQTREFQAEEKEKRILYRGFGTNKPGGLLANLFRMRFKNAANTSVVRHAGKTLALWEGGVPHAIDPETLETLGRDTYEDRLLASGWLDQLLAPELPFSAHPCIDKATGELWNFGTAYGAVNRLLIHRVDHSGVLTTRAVSMPDLPFVHDMALTERFAIFVLPKVTFDIPAALMGRKTPVESLRMQDEPGMAWLIPRDGGEPIQIPVPEGFVFHWAAAWEDDDHVHLEGVKYNEFPSFDDFEQAFASPSPSPLLARPVRLSFSLSRRESQETQLSDIALELPSTTGQPPNHVTFGVGAPADRTLPVLSCIVRLASDGQTRLRDFAPALPGEPVVAGPYLLVPLYNHGQPAEILILNQNDLSTECRLPLPHAVPSPLHGCWTPDGEHDPH